MPKFDPTATIEKIISEWGDIEKESIDPAASTTTEPEAPENPPVEPEAPETPPTETESPEEEDDLSLEDFISPPGGDIWNQTEAPSEQPQAPQKIKLSDGSEVTLEEVEALIRPSAPLPPPPTFPAVEQPKPPTLEQPPQIPLPAFSDEDLENPALRAIVMIAARQQEELLSQKALLEQIQQSTAQTQYRDNAEIVNSAMTQFKAQYRLPDELMDKIADRAGTLLPIKAQQMAEVGNFNPFEAVVTSLNDAYWLVPEARQFEFERQADHRQAALARQRKLNGVGGTSGSAPHTAPPPDPKDKQGVYNEMVAMVAADMGLQEGNN